MNEYMQDPNNANSSNPGYDTFDKASGLKYTNIILTILLAVVVIAGGVFIAMLVRINKEVSNNTRDMIDMSRDVSSMEDEVAHISRTVDDILEMGCTGSSGPGSNVYVVPYGPGGPYDPDDPDDPYDIYGPGEYGVEKPVIYLYSDGGLTEATVELTLSGADMTAMWPLADTDGDKYRWDVFVSADGTLTDRYGNEYSYLFWEASDYGEHSFDKGFCVAGSDTAEFLQNTLAEIGLSSKEANEFIAYWLPRMQGNAYNLISFEGLDAGDAYNTDYSLSVTDAEGNEADSVLRVMMAWKAVDVPVEIEAQKFEGFERNGFTVVEWGGAELTER